MPELPEVETIKNQLKHRIAGRRILRVRAPDPRVIKGCTFSEFRTRIEGLLVRNVSRRGKALLVALDGAQFLLMHLRISGWVEVSRGEEKYTRVQMEMEDGGILHFCDTRALGELRLFRRGQPVPFLAKMGPDPLALSAREFCGLFAGRKGRIKPLLMNQRFLAGVGNIYAQEALFCAKVHPARPADDLSGRELKRLYRCLLKLLRHAITCRGTSVDTFRQISGEKGRYVCFLKVYRRQGKECPRCGARIRQTRIGARGTAFCPRCQQ
ncbi:MAG: bifunctional DNA-formamidopyrimidine glycosylase/DNA-(apurinic or apyrimidinic site) lyase [Candidatus Omnitrophica bacterium]|nr:bifunctional DNA-formamidopyrimidine glycosylase/DNA-(apurinic or apyrimidinic site) lyase [Candidatus Omnitrophota bacterium]